VSVRHRARRALVGTAALAVVAAVALAPAAANAAEPDAKSPLNGINHIVVIYEENHSFDNLFGGWEGVNGLDQAPNKHVRQVATDGNTLYPCLLQNDVNLTTPPLKSKCTLAIGGKTFNSAFANKPFRIDDYIKPEDKTCPQPGRFAAHGISKDDKVNPGEPGGCTEDLVHRFYQEQYQINGGKMNRYVAGSDAAGLVMGYYDTKALPIYQYLHGAAAPNYTIADNFFQGAFGGSFLNHQWLIAAAAPTWPTAPAALHAVVDQDGYPGAGDATLHPATPNTRDGQLTQVANSTGKCQVPAGAPTPPKGTLCGDYVVNTTQPATQPYSPTSPVANRLPPITDHKTIGDLLTAKNTDWAWYAGGWSNADGNVDAPGWNKGKASDGVHCTDVDPNAVDKVSPSAVYPYCFDSSFQFHHQPFGYFATYGKDAQGKDLPARAAHLRDEVDFIGAAKQGKLKPVSFIKPLGEENEHPGYASEHLGSDHLVDLLKAIENGPQAADTAVVVTYDEFGGQWDHVSPPKGDAFGPGTRIPALIISPKLSKKFAVDHTEYDTTSILAMIEHRFGLPTVGKDTRDGKVNDLSAPFATAGDGGSGGGTGGGGTGGSGGGLPITGTNILALVIAGLVLVVGGGAAVVLGRRRRAG
jgi:acid phosphatase